MLEYVIIDSAQCPIISLDKANEGRGMLLERIKGLKVGSAAAAAAAVKEWRLTGSGTGSGHKFPLCSGSSGLVLHT